MNVYNDCNCVPGHRCDCWDYRANVSDAERLARVRRYVVLSLDIWSNDSNPIAFAVADMYQKVLNVIDTGNPMIATTLEKENR